MGFSPSSHSCQQNLHQHRGCSFLQGISTCYTMGSPMGCSTDICSHGVSPEASEKYLLHPHLSRGCRGISAPLSAASPPLLLLTAACRAVPHTFLSPHSLHCVHFLKSDFPEVPTEGPSCAPWWGCTAGSHCVQRGAPQGLHSVAPPWAPVPEPYQGTHCRVHSPSWVFSLDCMTDGVDMGSIRASRWIERLKISVQATNSMLKRVSRTA